MMLKWYSGLRQAVEFGGATYRLGVNFHHLSLRIWTEELTARALGQGDPEEKYFGYVVASYEGTWPILETLPGASPALRPNYGSDSPLWCITLGRERKLPVPTLCQLLPMFQTRERHPFRLLIRHHAWLRLTVGVKGG